MLEQENGLNREVDPKHFERLKLPLQDWEIPSDEIEDCIASASLLGAMVRMGIEVRDTSEHRIELTNPYFQRQDSGNLSTVSVDGLMIDETSEFAADFFAKNIPAPSPVAVNLPTESSAIVYTSDSENPEEGILGFVIHSPDVRFRVTLEKGKMKRIEIMHFEQVDDQIYLTKELNAFYRENQPDTLFISQSLAVEDPVYEKTERVTEQIERLRRMVELGAPRPLLREVKSHTRGKIATLSELIGAEMEGEEISELISNIANVSAEETLRQIFQKSGQADRADEIINMAKEGLFKQKRHGLSATISTSDFKSPLGRVDNIGKTTSLLAGWNQTLMEFKSQQAEMWLNWLGKIQEKFDEDFENIAAVVSGKIQFSEYHI